MKNTLFLLLILCFAACQPAPKSPEAQLKEAEEAVRLSFLDLYEKYVAADISYTGYYEEQVIRMDGKGQVKLGKKEHVENQKQIYETYEVQMLDYSDPTILPGLDQCMTYNTYEEYFIHKETGDTSLVIGTWVALWRKQPDDSWKLRMTTWHQE
jgi:hypothetical protein